MRFAALKLSICLLCVALGACSYLENKRKVDYPATRQLPPLDVPPDLMATPDASASPQRTTYTEVVGDKQASSAGTSTAAVLPQISGVTLERDGQARWLVVQASPESLWPYMRQFLENVGLVINRENPTTGVIETDWIEIPAKGAASGPPPAKWLSRFSPMATRDKFRIRLERGAKPGVTEMYLSHYGVEEASSRNSNSRWQPRSAEPDVEAEMLRLLVTYLGRTDVQAKTIVAQASAPATERAQLARRGDSFKLSLEDSLDRAWRRVGLSLDRGGFTVEDRDRSKGVYYVRYIDPDKQSGKPGWLGRIFRSDDSKFEERYQIQLQGNGAGTEVVVKNSDGVPEFGNTSERILSLLYEQLK